MVILSLAVSTSSKLGLLISMLRNLLGLRFALGVFVRMEYNRNRRFNFVGKGVPLVGVGIGTLTVIRIALLIPFAAGPRPRFPTAIPALFENLNYSRSFWNRVREDASIENTMPSFLDSLGE